MDPNVGFLSVIMNCWTMQQKNKDAKINKKKSIFCHRLPQRQRV